MKELDVVKLIKEFNGLPVGTKDAIVLEYDDTYYEVEFFDSNGDTIGVFPTPRDVLELVASNSPTESIIQKHDIKVRGRVF